MKSFDYKIKDIVGIHARPAGLLVKEASKYKDCTITIEKGDKKADAKKLFAVMGLGAKFGETVTVKVDGSNEDETAKNLKSFFEVTI